MKNPIELLQEVKKLVFQEETMPAPSYSLEDGTKVLIDKLEVGGVVTLEDGTPAPAGSHTLADGTEIVLAEGGVIAEIKPKEVEAPEVSVEIESGEHKDEEKMAEIEEMKAKIKKMEDELKEGKEKMSAFEVDYSDLKEASMKAQEALQSLILLVETMVNVPSQAPAEVPNNFKKHSASTKEDKIRSYSKFVSQFKNK
jgi:FtsZ-binding cell division protein ZapB